MCHFKQLSVWHSVVITQRLDAFPMIPVHIKNIPRMSERFLVMCSITFSSSLAWPFFLFFSSFCFGEILRWRALLGAFFRLLFFFFGPPGWAFRPYLLFRINDPGRGIQGLFCFFRLLLLFGPIHRPGGFIDSWDRSRGFKDNGPFPGRNLYICA